MIDDIKKSFNSILYERTTSPFYGTLILSWVIWNWRIIYLTLFISEDKIEGNKINYIIDNFSDFNHLITCPLLSTVIILTIIPFISNGAYWLSLKFNKWKRDKKNIVDMKQLLTLEQSIALREQISKQEERFDKLLENKNLEMKQLNAIIDDYKKPQTPAKTKEKKTPEINQTELKEISKRLKSNQNESIGYQELTRYIQGGYKPISNERIDSKLIALLESYDIIKNIGNGLYQFTEKGKSFQRLMSE